MSDEPRREPRLKTTGWPDRLKVELEALCRSVRSATLTRFRSVPTCRNRILRVGLSGLLAALAAGCQQGGGPPPTPPVDVGTAQVKVEPVQDRLNAVGTLLADEEVTLMPEIAGRVTAIPFTEGQRVEVGAVLFEFDREKEQAQLDQARVDLQLAQQNAERVEKLAGTRAISKQEIDQVRSQVTLREAALAFQQERLNDMQIKAPFAGIVGPRAVSAGQFVNVGEPLVTLTDDARVKVSYSVPEAHLAELRVGQPVEIKVAAFGDRVFPGEVQLINPQVDESTRTVEVRALADNPDRLLRPGMFARVGTITGTRPQAVVVPEAALVPSLTGFAVYVVDTAASNTVARLTKVDLGQRMSGRVEVRKGLAAGQDIVVAGTQKLMDGAPIAPQPAGEPAVAGAASNSTADSADSAKPRS
ncbi:MAG: efflux RND transporter periplasmic adaptor subunit [Verrucomicrobiales bacterium]|nr:efflux RND transporter periplasmic adaptor subunit [Verrucomicrobiales bacterium]